MNKKISTSVLTNKRRRDKLFMSAKNKLKKGTKTMRDKTKKLHNNLKKHNFYRGICLLSRTAVRTAQMIVPALVGGYLINQYDDKVVIFIGVALAIYSLLRVVNSAYLAEASK